MKYIPELKTQCAAVSTTLISINVPEHTKPGRLVSSSEYQMETNDGYFEEASMTSSPNVIALA
jgi:hypothetical protein